MFKEMNLSQSQAQKLIDFYSSKTSTAVKSAAEEPFKVWNDLQEKWVKEVKADPEIGSKLPEVRQTVSKAIDSFGDPALAAAFREAMTFTGAGNHPAFVKMFYKLAQAHVEGTHVNAGNPSPAGQRAPGTKPDAAHAMYPNLT